MLEVINGKFACSCQVKNHWKSKIFLAVIGEDERFFFKTVKFVTNRKHSIQRSREVIKAPYDT